MINPYELVLLEDEMTAIILGTTTFIQITASASNKSQQVKTNVLTHDSKT